MVNGCIILSATWLPTWLKLRLQVIVVGDDVVRRRLICVYNSAQYPGQRVVRVAGDAEIDRVQPSRPRHVVLYSHITTVLITGNIVEFNNIKCVTATKRLSDGLMFGHRSEIYHS